MTVTATSAKFPFTGNGATTAFPFTGRIFNVNEIQFWLGGIQQFTGFTVTFNVAPPYGGTVTAAVAPANGVAVLVVRATPRTQNTDWIESGSDSAASKEDAVDRAMNIDQEQDEAIGRAPKFPITSLLTPVLDVPGAGDVGKFVTVKDVNGNQGYATAVPSGSLNNPVSLAQGGTGVNVASQALLAQALGFALWATGSDLASAATLPLPNPLTGDRYRVTGAVGITALATAGIADGTVIWLTFTSSPLFTHGANLQLMGATNYQAGSADIIAFQLGSGSTVWREVARIINPVILNAPKFWRGDGTWQAPSYSRVMGLVGVNNAGTPNSQYDLSAAGIVFLNPVDGSFMTKHNQGVLTNNVLTAGPAANGRDQAGAFGANSWIHFYFIIKLDGTVATVSSLTAPPTGPVLPSTYIAWAYCGAVRYEATPLLVPTLFRGAFARVVGTVNWRALNGGAATVETAVSLVNFIPPNAVTVQIKLQTLNSASAGINTIVYERAGEGATGMVAYNGGIGFFGSSAATLANVSQQVFYLSGAANSQAFIDIMGYTMPNGGE